MALARWKSVIVWVLDGVVAVAEITGVVTHHAALADAARAVAALARKGSAAIRGER